MDVTSNDVCVRVILTPSESVSIARYLTAMQSGGELHSHDFGVVNQFRQLVAAQNETFSNPIANAVG